MQPLSLHELRPHELYECQGEMRCRKCPRFSGVLASRAACKSFARSACAGSVAERALESTGMAAANVSQEAGPYGRGHKLYLNGQLVFCISCGCYGDKRMRDLKRPCRGPAARAARETQLRRLRAGLHPQTKRHLGTPVPLRVAAASSGSDAAAGVNGLRAIEGSS